MSMFDQLTDMGFAPDIAEAALKATNETGLEEAIDWITTKQATSETKDVEMAVSCTEDTKESTDESNESSIQADPAKAMSFKCDECGKLLIDDNAVMFHAARTKHEKYSESTEQLKPLTEEEKRKKLADLHGKLIEIRAKKEEEKKKEDFEKEKKRRLEGKSSQLMQEERRLKEQKKIIDDLRREKQEEKLAMQRIREQIRLDREAKKASMEKQIASAPEPKTAPLEPLKPNLNYTGFCNLQVRLPDSSFIKNKFEAAELLSTVRDWVASNGNSIDTVDFNLVTQFPRTVFSEEHYTQSLNALGLCPSATLIMVPQRREI